ncbi:MAG: sensor histidine kinase KdpD [Chloroflexi bacterium]|nr:sensor histidine kinase KdpD [Chloroflexota bacterium]
MKSLRPDPDTFPKHRLPQDAERPRGKLKVFLGYAAGVGKTYAMLEAAQQRLEEGIDVVAGYVETHGRAETDLLARDLVFIPRQMVHYHGVTLPEMNLDAILKRLPELVLVDELAHPNPPEMRHTKRYQDVEELLNMGIDVYTTLNIQNLESLNDIVAQITGIVVRETLPDRILDLADQIVLVDLPPEELLQRLHEGKVYIPEQTTFPMQKFFRQGNLTALREIALRRTARRVDDQMNAYMQQQAISGPWAAGERLLVSISPNPLSQRLIRTAKRLAQELDAEWYAVYIETPTDTRLSTEDSAQTANNLRLAEELGAKIVTLPGDNIAESLMQYANTHNITKIIVGKPLKPRWLEFLKGSIVDQLIRKSGNIDIYVISSTTPVAPPSPLIRPAGELHLKHYLAAVGLVSITSLLGLPIAHFISPTNLVMSYQLAVLIAAIRYGRGAATLTAVLSVFAFNFFFVPPRWTFLVHDIGYILTFAGLLSVGLVSARLAARVREHARAAEQRELQAMALYAFSRDLSASVELNRVLQDVLAHTSETFNADVAIWLYEHDTLELRIMTDHYPLTTGETIAAQWVYAHRQPAGHDTQTLPATAGRYLPLKTAQSTIGVLGVRFRQEEELTPERNRLLDAFASQAALGIDATLLAEKAQQTQLLREAEKLQSALLNSISHDLRTPLVSIAGALSSLRDQAGFLDETAKSELIDGAWEETTRLNQLVGNLLDMTRLEANAVSLRQSPSDVQEMIGVALSHMKERLLNHKVQVNIPPDLPLASADFVLIVQVMVNLLDNATKYTPRGSLIEIQASANGFITVAITDHGSGVSPEELPRIFDKFYRSEGASQVAGGTGLGLSICHGIIEAHKGYIWAENQDRGGLIVRFTLPIAQHPVG